MSDLISRQKTIDALVERTHIDDWESLKILHPMLEVIDNLPSARPEPLTDNEQRIFLAAMLREEKVCRQVDDENRTCRDQHEDSLVSICHGIIRKVKGALWMI